VLCLRAAQLPPSMLPMRSELFFRMMLLGDVVAAVLDTASDYLRTGSGVHTLRTNCDTSPRPSVRRSTTSHPQ
jgi:hypothetical protein